MPGKRVLVGALALLVGSFWLVLLMAQGPRLSVARRILASDAPIVFRLSVVPTLVLALSAVVLALPLIVGGTGAMLGLRGCTKVLRTSSEVGLAASAFVVLAFGAAVVPRFGAWMGPAHTLELAGAANLLILQAALLWLLGHDAAHRPLRSA
jgi:hypothetical protein